MQLILGIDGGSTKTVAIVADLEGRIRGIGRAGSSNWEAVGVRGTAAAISSCLIQALNMAEADRNDLVQAHLGLAGLDWPDDEPRLRAALADAGLPENCTMENDAFLGVRASSPDGHGVGVGAGTGVCACIIPYAGEPYYYGGFTDLGGGIDINAYALEAVIRAEDGRGRPTALTAPLLAAAGYGSVHQLVRNVCREDYRLPADILRPILFAVAAEGDPAAIRIVRGFGYELALCATNLIRRYQLHNDEPVVAASGSLFTQTGPLLFEIFRRRVLHWTPRAGVILARHPPVLGAVRQALQACGRTAPDVWERVCRTVPDETWFQTARN